MSDLSAFESVFRRALRSRFEQEEIQLGNILLINDLEREDAALFEEQVHQYLQLSLPAKSYQLHTLGRNNFSPWPQFRSHIARLKPDLIITYRLLWVEDISARKSLGSYIDLLSQDTDYPVLIMPHPKLFKTEKLLQKPGAVLVATEHLYDDHRLVNYALKFAKADQSLIMVHIEDEDTFDYYMDAIAKIPGIDTETARETLSEQLLAGPHHYAESVKEVLEADGSTFRLEEHIEFGHLITSYRALMEAHPTDLLVTNTKDDTQLAMHSIGYSLAVEFRENPVLLL
ncbi:MAG: hypothetical protein AAFV78_06300 [Bacteroidota bacterium]